MEANLERRRQRAQQGLKVKDTRLARETLTIGTLGRVSKYDCIVASACILCSRIQLNAKHDSHNTILKY